MWGLCLAAPAGGALEAQNPIPPPVQQPQTPPAGQPAPATPAVGQPSFADWLAGFRAEASSKGISDETLDEALTNLTPDPVVIERDRTQPELTQTLDTYIARRLTAKVMASAATTIRAQEPLLERVKKAYGVSPEIMIAVWGLESNFGQITGTHPIIASLATLAYDGRRQLFRNELLEALRILDRKLVRLEDMKGSWAGAMGQPQFMPSSYLKFAVDFDRDGSANIWTSVGDVFASMANYLQQAGWAQGERWGREVDVPADGWAAIRAKVPLRTTGCQARREMTEPRPVTAWRALGVTSLGNHVLPTSRMPASLVIGDHRAFLTYPNYQALLDYNCSNAYAISVGLLSDIAAAALH